MARLEGDPIAVIKADEKGDPFIIRNPQGVIEIDPAPAVVPEKRTDVQE